MEKAEPRVVTYWRISGIFGALLIFGGIGLQGLLFLASDSPTIGVVILAVAGGLGVLRVLWILLTTHLRYRRLAFEISERHLRIQHGVLVHREKTIPIARLQHLDVDRGPFERLFNLASLSVFTAGGRAATFRIPGLSPQRAEAIRANVLTHAGRGESDER
jgi:membrane protein YdbS with pleckstrin-like domain